MDSRELHVPAEHEALLKFGFRLAGETDHDVCCYGGIGQRAADLPDSIRKTTAIVLPVHALQHGIASALQCQVKMPYQSPILPQVD